MDNTELLSQVVALLKEQTQTMTSYIDQRISESMADQMRQIQLIIENDVTRRIDALFDGYKLTHEKQWELDRKTETMQAQITDLQLRLAALENKSA